MANPTSNYGWQMPTSTDLVTDLPADFEVFGQSADSTVFANAALAVNKTIVDAKGDLIAATAADTVSRVAVGANDTVLTADSAEATGMKWAAAAAGMTLLASGSLSGASVSLTSISSAYQNLYLVIRNYKPATNNSHLRGTINSDTNANRYKNEVETSPANVTFDEASFRISQGQASTVAQDLYVTTFLDYANTVSWKIINVSGVSNNGQYNSANINAVNWTDYYNQVGAISSIQLFNNAGNFTSGDYFLYGVK